MNELIAFCGIDCSECKAFVATQKNDNSMRKAVAEEWSKAFGHEMKPAEINCVGCVAKKGSHINYCSICEIRKCGSEKDVENCAYCADYKCEKLEKFHEQATKAKDKLEEIRRRQRKN